MRTERRGGREGGREGRKNGEKEEGREGEMGDKGRGGGVSPSTLEIEHSYTALTLGSLECSES